MLELGQSVQLSQNQLADREELLQFVWLTQMILKTLLGKQNTTPWLVHHASYKLLTRSQTYKKNIQSLLRKNNLRNLAQMKTKISSQSTFMISQMMSNQIEVSAHVCSSQSTQTNQNEKAFSKLTRAKTLMLLKSSLVQIKLQCQTKIPIILRLFSVKTRHQSQTRTLTTLRSRLVETKQKVQKRSSRKQTKLSQ
jgi:hypothetical protein